MESELFHNEFHFLDLKEKIVRNCMGIKATNDQFYFISKAKMKLFIALSVQQ